MLQWGLRPTRIPFYYGMLMRVAPRMNSGMFCLFSMPKRVWLCVFCVFLLSAASSLASESTNLDADTIIHKAVDHAQTAEKQPDQKDFTYTKVSVTEELDARGNVKERKEKVYRVYFQKGATYAKLVEVNGKPLGHADLKAQADNEATTRQVLGDAKPTKGEKSFLTPEVVARFDFKLIGKENINDRPAWQITFAPKSPEPPVHAIIDRLINRISGTVWIDAQEFEIARADLKLGSEVNLLGGVVGSLKKLAYTMTRTRMADGIWLNTSSNGDFEGRKLIDAMRIKTHSRAVGFKPLG